MAYARYIFARIERGSRLGGFITCLWSIMANDVVELDPLPRAARKPPSVLGRMTLHKVRAEFSVGS